MIKTPLITIIIPVYNEEKYLDTCIKSVAAQDYKNLEVILVDDGSKDNSGKMCDDYAKEYSFFRVIHQENGGLSAARNTGIKAAKGEYITFLDSDDYITDTFVSDAYALCEYMDADITAMGMKYTMQDEDFRMKDNTQTELLNLTPEQAIKESLLQKRFSCCAPGKLYKRSAIGDIRFPVGKLSEDLATCHLFLNNADRIVCSDKVGYFYRQQPASIMHTFNARRWDAVEWAKKIEEFCLKKYPAIADIAKCRTFNVAVHLLLDLPDKTHEWDEIKKNLWHEVKRTRMTVLKNTEVRGREKAAAFLSFFGLGVMKKVWNSRLAVRKDN